MMVEEAKARVRSRAARNPNRLVPQWLGRALTWPSTLVIVVLSLVPPSLRPVTPLSHNREHFAIFVMWGMAFGLGYGINFVYPLAWAVLFAGSIELAQFLVPGRHPRISDFVVDTEAAFVGVLFARIFFNWLAVWLNRRRQQSIVGRRFRQRTRR
jgi:VanZ family protein